MLTLLFIWLAVGIALAFLSGRSSAGLPLAYFLGLSLIHVPGAVIHLDAEAWDKTRLGFEQTVIGIVAFVIAVAVAKGSSALMRPDRNASPLHRGIFFDSETAALDGLARLCCLIGGFTYFVVLPFAGKIPSATAIVSSLGSLMIIGLCFRLWTAQNTGSRLKFWSTIIFLPVLPLFALIQTGFLGYGTYWMIAIMSFLFSQTKRRLLYICFAPALFFVGLSIFVNYMAARNDIRQLVWYQRASLSVRLERVEAVFSNFEWLDLTNARQRRAIDLRLNQNYLVGAAVTTLNSGLREYASGATISDVMISLIPRALWPGKPAVGGGGDVVAKYTGIRFAQGTSVGAGQVLEFYVNFGTWGVIGGFLIYGLLLGFLDLMIIRYLRQGEARHCVLVFMVGVNLLQPGGNLVEIIVAAAGAAVGALGVGFAARRWSGGGVYVLQRNVSLTLQEER